MPDTLDALEERIREKVREALDKEQYDLAASRTMLARRVQELKREKEQIEVQLGKNGTADAAAFSGSAPSAHALMLIVSQGDLNQNLLRTGDLRRRQLIPSDDQPFTVVARSPKGDFNINTTIDETHGRLRERGLIARFYRENQVKAGDRVTWANFGPRTYVLNKV